MEEKYIHGKLTAIQYLIDNTAYGDEFSGAGMYEGIVKVMTSQETTFYKSYLDELLQEAKDF